MGLALGLSLSLPPSLSFTLSFCDFLSLTFCPRCGFERGVFCVCMRKPAGMVNVAELRKIVEVPFPFPYSQYLSFMLVLHWLVSPLVCVQLISEWSWAGGTVWLISTSYWTLCLGMIRYISFH